MKRFDEQGLEDAVNRITDRWGRDVKALMECRHQIMADLCSVCAGETLLFGPVDEVRRFLEARKLLSIEIVDASKSAKRGAIQKGAVVSAGLIFGALAWEGGKIILRLLQRGKENRP